LEEKKWMRERREEMGKEMREGEAERVDRRK
jgi:hypothetical protein